MWKRLANAAKKDLSDSLRLKKAKLYADEDIEDEVVEFLREKGVIIRSARELGHIGKPDTFHAALAFKQNRFLLTKNAKHYLDDSIVPFHRTQGIIVVEGDMGEMESYVLTFVTLLNLIPIGEMYTGTKIRIAQNEFTVRFVDSDGILQKKRYKVEGERAYEWVNRD